MSEPTENTQSPAETPDAERRYPDDARRILSLGQEAYESTRQMQVDGGQHVPRAEQPERLPGDEKHAERRSGDETSAH